MSPSNLPSISVVIPTHDRRDRLPALLEALAGEAAEEIVVIATASGDGSLDLLKERAREDPRLRSVRAEEAGQMQALQAGVEQAQGEIILMLDDDVLPEPGLVSGHASHHAAARGLVLLGYMPVALPRPHRRGQYPAVLYAHAYELACAEYERDPGSILRGLWGGNVSMRRSDCLRVGLAGGDGLPGGYGYHEDRDLGLRCEAAGLRGVFDRRLRARHQYAKTPEAFLAAARNSGATRATVHARHAEAIGPLADDFYERVVPLPGRLSSAGRAVRVFADRSRPS